MIKLKCECCGIEKSFRNGEEAFNQGWDCPPYFTGYVACNLCPGSYIILGKKVLHIPIHKKWEIDGRPEEFSIETCIDIQKDE